MLHLHWSYHRQMFFFFFFFYVDPREENELQSSFAVGMNEMPIGSTRLLIRLMMETIVTYIGPILELTLLFFFLA